MFLKRRNYRITDVYRDSESLPHAITRRDTRVTQLHELPRSSSIRSLRHDTTVISGFNVRRVSRTNIAIAMIAEVEIGERKREKKRERNFIFMRCESHDRCVGKVEAIIEPIGNRFAFLRLMNTEHSCHTETLMNNELFRGHATCCSEYSARDTYAIRFIHARLHTYTRNVCSHTQTYIHVY